MGDPIDVSQYVTVPRTTGRHLLSLARMLIKYTPAKPDEGLVYALGVLQTVLVRVLQAYIERAREYGPSSARADFEFDQYVDGLLYTIRDSCVRWEVFEKPAVISLSEATVVSEFHYVGALERARRARRIGSLLFGRGLDYTRQSFMVQSEHMVELDRMIEEDDLGDELEELVGQMFIDAFRDAHQRYLAMVERRAARGQGSTVNLRALNNELQLAIQRYMLAVVVSYRPTVPESEEQTRRALRPVDALREQLARDRQRLQAVAAGEDPEAIEGVDEADLEGIAELADEQKAVDVELGIEPGDEMPGPE